MNVPKDQALSNINSKENNGENDQVLKKLFSLKRVKIC